MVIWDKGPMGMGWHYRRSYECVLVAEKPGGPTKWYDTTRKIENIIRPGDYGVRKIIPSADEHPTPKPSELAAHFIALHTKPGDVVLDCFSGRRWVGEAAVRMGRRFVGVEIDEHWADRALGRIAVASSQGQLFSGPQIAPGVRTDNRGDLFAGAGQE
jgi:DNA modification methylase